MYAEDLAPEDLYGDLYAEEGISDELKILNLEQVSWCTETCRQSIAPRCFCALPTVLPSTHDYACTEGKGLG